MPPTMHIVYALPILAAPSTTLAQSQYQHGAVLKEDHGAAFRRVMAAKVAEAAA